MTSTCDEDGEGTRTRTTKPPTRTTNEDEAAPFGQPLSRLRRRGRGCTFGTAPLTTTYDDADKDEEEDEEDEDEVG